MNVMNGLIAVGIAVAAFALILIWSWLMYRWPAETTLGTAAVFALAIIFMAGAYA